MLFFIIFFDFERNWIKSCKFKCNKCNSNSLHYHGLGFEFRTRHLLAHPLQLEQALRGDVAKEVDGVTNGLVGHETRAVRGGGLDPTGKVHCRSEHLEFPRIAYETAARDSLVNPDANGYIVVSEYVANGVDMLQHVHRELRHFAHDDTITLAFPSHDHHAVPHQLDLLQSM